jgi:hypothetical protein
VFTGGSLRHGRPVPEKTMATMNDIQTCLIMAIPTVVVVLAAMVSMF